MSILPNVLASLHYTARPCVLSCKTESNRISAGTNGLMRRWFLIDWFAYLLRMGVKAYKQWQKDQARVERERQRATAKWQREQARIEKERAKELERERKRRAVVSLNREVGSLSPYEFERFVSNLFRQDGWETSVTPEGRDTGIDIELYRRSDGTRAVVQCKQWKANVGQPVVRDLYGALMHVQADKGYVVTTGGFTKGALEFVEGKPIELIGRGRLLQWTERASEKQLCSTDSKAALLSSLCIVLRAIAEKRGER